MSAAIELERVDFFANTNSGAIERLRPHVREESFPAMQTIFDEGDEARDIYILRSGQVELTYTLPTHRETNVRITMVRPGQLFAWSALTGGTKLTATAVALADSSAFIVPVCELRKVMDAVPDFGYRIMDRVAALIARRLADTRTQLQWLTTAY